MGLNFCLFYPIFLLTSAHMIRSFLRGLSDSTKIFLHWFEAVWGWQTQSIFGMMRSKGKWGKISRNSTPFATQPCANLPHSLLLRCPTKYPYDELKEWGLSNPTLTNFLICAKSAWKSPAKSEVDSTSLFFSEVCQTPRKVPDHVDLEVVNMNVCCVRADQDLLEGEVFTPVRGGLLQNHLLVLWPH